jgi:hypothetical protein
MRATPCNFIPPVMFGKQYYLLSSSLCCATPPPPAQLRMSQFNVELAASVVTFLAFLQKFIFSLHAEDKVTWPVPARIFRKSQVLFLTRRQDILSKNLDAFHYL